MCRCVSGSVSIWVLTPVFLSFISAWLDMNCKETVLKLLMNYGTIVFVTHSPTYLLTFFHLQGWPSCVLQPKIVEKWFEEHNNECLLDPQIPLISVHSCITGVCWTNSSDWSIGEPCLTAGLIGSSANCARYHSRLHHQGSYEVHDSRGQNWTFCKTLIKSWSFLLLIWIGLCIICFISLT